MSLILTVNINKRRNSKDLSMVLTIHIETVRIFTSAPLDTRMQFRFYLRM
jgi:hypothetical protein